MAKKDLKPFIFKDIYVQGGSGESARVYLCVHISDGKSELVIEKTITERFPVTDFDKVTDLYERLTCASGRKAWQLEELAHGYNPN